MSKCKILPSIMCCSGAAAEAYVRAFEESKQVEAIHFDVMDGHYVPNVMLGTRDYQDLKKMTDLPIDIHLMTTTPEKFVEIYNPCPGDWVSFHPETAQNPYRLLQDIKARGCRAGIALSPGVPVSYITELRSVIDFVLVMAVNPGFSGQKMVPDHLDKLSRIKEEVSRCPVPVDIFIDGNTILENSRKMRAAGATGVVVGTSTLLRKPASEFVEACAAFVQAVDK